MKKSKAISRRELLGAGVAAATGTLISPGTSLGARLSAPQSGRTTGGSPRALVLMCDRYHNQDYIRVSLDQLFKEDGYCVGSGYSTLTVTISYGRVGTVMVSPFSMESGEPSGCSIKFANLAVLAPFGT
jgi:hypothetical protein